MFKRFCELINFDWSLSAARRKFFEDLEPTRKFWIEDEAKNHIQKEMVSACAVVKYCISRIWNYTIAILFSTFLLWLALSAIWVATAFYFGTLDYLNDWVSTSGIMGLSLIIGIPTAVFIIGGGFYIIDLKRNISRSKFAESKTYKLFDSWVHKVCREIELTDITK